VDRKFKQIKNIREEVPKNLPV